MCFRRMLSWKVADHGIFFFAAIPRVTTGKNRRDFLFLFLHLIESPFFRQVRGGNPNVRRRQFHRLTANEATSLQKKKVKKKKTASLAAAERIRTGLGWVGRGRTGSDWVGLHWFGLDRSLGAGCWWLQAVGTRSRLQQVLTVINNVAFNCGGRPFFVPQTLV